MKAIVFHTNQVPGQTAPSFLPGLAHLELCDVPVPDLPTENWVLIKSKIAGICGSDLAFLQGKAMPAFSPYFQVLCSWDRQNKDCTHAAARRLQK